MDGGNQPQRSAEQQADILIAENKAKEISEKGVNDPLYEPEHNGPGEAFIGLGGSSIGELPSKYRGGGSNQSLTKSGYMRWAWITLMVVCIIVGLLRVIYGPTFLAF